LPTPCARDGKGPGHQYGLPDVVEPHGSRHALLPTPTAVAYGSNRSPSPGATRRPRLATVAGQRLLPTPRATDGIKGCPGQRGSHGDLTLPAAAVRITTLATPPASDARGPGGHGDGADLRTAIAGLGTPDSGRWGTYAAAIARWERLLGRPVPQPTQSGRHGKPVLAPPFVEWLMGLPDGFVTGLGLPRTAALRVLGNGVVVAQAASALRLLLCPHRWAVTE
jgi:DNA (cytosine-5)-methyltransferase 1